MASEGGRTVEGPGLWKTYVVFPFARVVAGLLALVLGPLRVKGWGRVPLRGGLLIVANHQSYFDPVALYLGCRRHVIFIARDEVWGRPTIAKIMAYFTALQIRPGMSDKEAIKLAVAHLKAGRCVCIFPEGGLSKTGELLPIQAGFSLIAKLAGVPVIACGLDGTNRVIPHDTEKPRMAKRWVTVRWGKPIPPGTWANGDEAVACLTEELQQLKGSPRLTPP